MFISLHCLHCHCPFGRSYFYKLPLHSCAAEEIVNLVPLVSSRSSRLKFSLISSDSYCHQAVAPRHTFGSPGQALMFSLRLRVRVELTNCHRGFRLVAMVLTVPTLSRTSNSPSQRRYMTKSRHHTATFIFLLTYPAHLGLFSVHHDGGNQPKFWRLLDLPASAQEVR